MSLKKKLILLLSVSGFLLVFILYAGFGLTMLPSLKDQKDIFIKKLKRKIEVALSIEEDNITALCREFTDWDRLVEYIANPTENFEREALPDAMFTDGMIDVVVILNARGRILFYKNYRSGEGFVGFNRPQVIDDDMKAINQRIRQRMGPLEGFIETSVEPLMFVAHPVLNRRRLNRREGVLLMGRYVDERMLQRISFYSVEKILALELTGEAMPAFWAALEKLQHIRYRETEENIMVFQGLKDVYGELKMLLYTETDNRLFVAVNRHVFTFSVVSFVLIFLFGILIYLSVDKYLLDRMRSISEGMRRIEGFGDLSVRIDSDGKRDEVSRLITDVNLTLDRLEHEKNDRENAEKSMVKQGKLASIGRLASSIAHEINNPLVAISSSIQVLKSVCTPKEGEAASLYSEAMEITESETERIRHIISGLLDFHRLDKEEFSRVNLKDILLQSISIMNWTKKLGDIEIVTELKDDIFVFGAPVRLEQVFINFISNAAEAVAAEAEGSGGGKEDNIRIQALLTEGPGRKYAEVHFLDNGPGLSDTVKGSLFEPFVTTKEDKGVGLGLYISYKIIRNHGGEIVYNEDFEGGAHFIIRIPLDRRAEERVGVSLTPSP